MLAGVMWSLASQQRRLLSGNLHISFSRKGGVEAYAAASSSGRRSRRSSDKQPEQQQKQDNTIRGKNKGHSSQDQHKNRKDLLAQKSAKLRLIRASDVPCPESLDTLQSRAIPVDSDRAPSSSITSADDLNGSSAYSISSSTGSRSRSRAACGDRPAATDDGDATRSSSRSSFSSIYDSSCSADTDDSSDMLHNSSRHASTRASSSSITTMYTSSTPEPDTPTTIISSRRVSDSSNNSSSNAGTEEAETYDSSRDNDAAIQGAISRITRFLDFRERCASEVMTKLAELGYDKQLALQVLARLQEAGIQSDARFAEMFAHSCWRTKAASPVKIGYELRARKVSQQHIDAALRSVFGSSKQVAGREPCNKQEEATWQQLVEVCQRRVDVMRLEPPQKRRAKLATWLQRRGHPLATAFRMFEELGI